MSKLYEIRRSSVQKKNEEKATHQRNKKIKVIPLGGLHEIGKNMTAFEYGSDLLLLDAGLAFPGDDMLGIDMVIPDITSLQKQKNRIRGIVITHGHEDHIGAIPYVLKEFNVPVFGTKLTLGILRNKLEEHGILDTTKLNVINPGEVFRLGEFKVEFIRSNHSIADAVAVALHTPTGVILHTGDFKIDSTPIDGEMIDLGRIGELGKNGVLLLMSDSTNAERKGYTMSERTVGATFDHVFDNCTKRIFIATFASNIHRVQQIINTAVKYGRKVAVSGRSMENVLAAAIELGYMDIPKNTLIKLDEIGRYSKEQLVIVTTGSQGETMSALSRMAFAGHKKVNIEPDDLVIISASPIPGNEKAISNVINELLKKGAEVIYESLADVHVSGHACQEELKIILALAKPRYFMPVHGEFKHLSRHRSLALQMGMKTKDIFMMENGQVLELSQKDAKITGTVPSGRVLVDGLGVGDVGSIVLRDRKHLSEDGLIVVVMTIDQATKTAVAGPDIISRGFVYVRESEDLMESMREKACDVVEDCLSHNTLDWASLKTHLKNELGSFIFSKTKRKPMILPVIMDI
ncbi:MAG: ribonuclease J [Clostridia bacterium]|nr:ribonuclease J [Clostridia bacterium]